MKRNIQRAAAAAVVALLAACGGSGSYSGGSGGGTPDPAKPTVKVDELATGSYLVSTGDAASPTLGRYYAGADGQRLLVLEDAGESIDKVLRREGASAAWVAVPAPAADLQVTLLRSESRKPATPDAATLAGRYVVRLSDGSAADFVIGADGRIAAGTLPGCRLSGLLAASSLPGALALQLDSSGCAGLPAHARGVLVTDTQDAPATLRLLADDGNTPVDLRGYAEPAA